MVQVELCTYKVEKLEKILKYYFKGRYPAEYKPFSTAAPAAFDRRSKARRRVLNSE